MVTISYRSIVPIPFLGAKHMFGQFLTFIGHESRLWNHPVAAIPYLLRYMTKVLKPPASSICQTTDMVSFV